jgi:DNA-binding MarR family transcriptional regulator
MNIATEEIPTGPTQDNGRAPNTAERYDLRVLRSIRRIIRRVDMYSKQLEMQSHITAPQLVCLLAVVNNGAMTATSLAREIHLSPSTVVGILDRLEDKGLVVREREKTDRRIVRVSVTPAGIDLARTVPSPLHQTLTEGLDALPEPEQAAIALALEQVVELMEAEHLDSAPILETGPIFKP